MANLVVRDYNDMAFEFRTDGWFNMTKASRCFGKPLADFWRSAHTAEYVKALHDALGVNSGGFPEFIPDAKGRVTTAYVQATPLVETREGRSGGTWAHPKLAVFFARWLDVRFAVFCDMVIDDLIRGKAEVVITKPEESAALALPKDYLSALKQLVAAEEERQRLAAENAAMHKELYEVSIDEYRAIHHHAYWSHSYRIKLAQEAKRLAAAKGIVLERQRRTVTKYGKEIPVTVLIYPKEILDQAKDRLDRTIG